MQFVRAEEGLKQNEKEGTRERDRVRRRGAGNPRYVFPRASVSLQIFRFNYSPSGKPALILKRHLQMPGKRRGGGGVRGRGGHPRHK